MGYVANIRKYVGHQPLILPGSVVGILNEENELLLQQRLDGSWGLPGGIMELGESMEETARREVKEESGLEVGELTLVHVFSGKDFYLKVPNGDELYSVTAVYITKDVRGSLQVDPRESMGMEYVSIDHLPTPLNSGTHKFLEAISAKLSILNE